VERISTTVEVHQDRIANTWSSLFPKERNALDKVRLGYVGCGFMAQKVHIPNFASIDGCELAAVAEVREDIRESVADRYGIPTRYAHHLELAQDKDIDAVAVSAASTLQGELAIDLLKAGKPVFMEKPMATTVEAARRILDAEREGGARLMIAYMKRYDAGNIVARDTIRAFRESGEIGPVTYVRAHGFCGDWTANIDTPMDQSAEDKPPAPGGVPDWVPENRARRYLGFLQQYTHNINLVRWLLDAGDDARCRIADLDDDGISGTTILQVAGARVVLESGSVSYYSWDEHTQVFFREGWVKTSSPSLLLKNVPASVEVYRGKPTPVTACPIPSPAWTWSYKNEAVHFIEKVKSGEPFDSSAQDTATDVRLYEEIYRDFLTRRGEV
jgi:predicted dehydrogenase